MIATLATSLNWIYKSFLEMEIGYLDGKDCKRKVKNHPIDDTHP
jgi:hypothetical protein